MDFSVVTAAVSSINTAKAIGKSLVELRDFSQTAGIVAQLNGELLKAQESLFTLSAQLNELQQERHEMSQQLRDAQDRLAERGKYSLYEISDRVFVYRFNEAPHATNEGSDGNGVPIHYVCQPCFDKGTKAVLQKCILQWNIVALRCPICKQTFPT